MSSPSPSWAWLFNNPTLADVTIRVVAVHKQQQPGVVPEAEGQQGKHQEQQQEQGPGATGVHESDDGSPAAKKAKLGSSLTSQPPTALLGAGTTATGKNGPPQVLLEMPGHKQVLTSESEYLRARVLRWGEAAGAPVDQGRWGPVLELQVTLGPSDIAADAARQVLQHAYTWKVDLPDAVQLTTAAVLADLWAMPACLDACLDRLASGKDIHTQLQVRDIDNLLHPRLPAGVTGHGKYKALQEVCKQRLLQLFPGPHTVLSDKQQLGVFCSLSFPAVLMWAGLDELQVESENSVAALITWWWHTNKESVGQAEAAQLTGQLRLLQLSSSYLAALDQLPWFEPPTKALQAARFLHACGATGSSAKDVMPATWSAKARMAAEGAPVLEAKFTRAQLDDLHSRAAHGRAFVAHPDTVYWCGYMWDLSLWLGSQQGELLVAVAVAPALPRSSEQAPLVGMRARVACLGLRDGRLRWKEHVCENLGAKALQLGWTAMVSMLGVHPAQQPRANSYPPDNLWVDGTVQLQLTVLQVQ